MDKWEVNGISLAFDITDADFIDKVDAAFKAMRDEEKTISKDGKISDIIRAMCRMYFNFFSNVFGNEASEKIFESTSTSVAAYEEVYFSFLDFVAKQGESRKRRKNEVISRFRPNKPKFHKKHK